MANHLFLPELSGEGISPPEKAGFWDKQERSVIQSLGDGIVVSENAKTRGVSSVPDIWARPLVFKSAIKRNSGHPMRKRYLQEWRGLLSLLALSKVKSYPVSLHRVPLNEETFSLALKKLTPKPVQMERENNYHWTDILIILFENIAIGAFSPATLVYTGAGYATRLLEKDLVLKDELGFLCPPTQHRELASVNQWIMMLRNKLKKQLFTQQENDDNLILTNIIELLEEWVDDNRKTLRLEEGVGADALDIGVSNELYGVEGDSVKAHLQNYPIFRNLLFPLETITEEDAAYHSDTALKFKRNSSPYREIVIITPNLLSQKLRIWKEKSLDDLGGDVQTCLSRYFDDDQGNEINQELLTKEQAIWVRPEKYFLSDTLVRGKGSPFLQEAEAELNLSHHYLLPFKKEILQFFSPVEVIQMLKPEYAEEKDGIRFSFTLPTIQGNEKIEKFYKIDYRGDRTKPDVLDIETPVIEIFPNYLDCHWRRYYLFQSNADEFLAEPVNFRKPGSTIAVTSRKHTDSASVAEQQSIRITQISGDDAFPEAVQINSAEHDIVLGLILLSRPKDPSELVNTWRVGVDFGTSNTNIYRITEGDDKQKAERWEFHFSKHLRSLTASASIERRRLLNRHFVPNEDIALPIPTTLRIVDDSRKDIMMLDYHIYFPRDHIITDDVKCNIKWDAAGERKTEYFLENLLFLIMIEAVSQRINTIKLACSYPKAFPPKYIDVYKSEWSQIIQRCTEGEKSFYDGGLLDLRHPKTETEGRVAGEYFASEMTIKHPDDRANIATAALCLDIGGGTTDISLWYRNQIVYDASITLAGHQIANIIRENKQARGLLFSESARRGLEDKLGDSAKFAATLNIILRGEEDRVKQMLVKHANQKVIDWLLQMIAFEFCAIAYYAAQLTAAFDKNFEKIINALKLNVEDKEKIQSFGKPLEWIQQNGIALHWGGNAAKLISWLDFGEYKKDGRAAKLLNGVYFNALKRAGARVARLNQLQSPEHKSEAAGGLVVTTSLFSDGEKRESITNFEEIDIDDLEFGDEQQALASSPASGEEARAVGIVCGEDIELQNRSLDTLDLVTLDDLFDQNSTTFKTTTLNKLSEFVKIFNTLGGRFGLISEGSKIQLPDSRKARMRQSFLNTFIKLEEIQNEQRILEPLFIMEIKALQDYLWTERD